MSIDIALLVQNRKELSEGTWTPIAAAVPSDRVEDLGHLAADDLARHVREPVGRGSKRTTDRIKNKRFARPQREPGKSCELLSAYVYVRARARLLACACFFFTFEGGIKVKLLLLYAAQAFCVTSSFASTAVVAYALT